MEDVHFNRQGLRLIALTLVTEAIVHKDEMFFLEPFGAQMLDLVEAETGLTLEILKTRFVEKRQEDEAKFDKLILKDAKKLTIKQICEKYSVKEPHVRYLLKVNNVDFLKARNKDERLKSLISQITDFNGKLSLTEISIKTKTNFNTIKSLCIQNNLPYKKTEIRK